MSPTSTPSKIDDLAAHIPDVQRFAPGLMADLGPLLNAARAATGVGEGRDVMILNADLDNLREGITTLVTLKSTGFASQDIVDAEKDIRLLMTDMQNRCGRILSDKSKMLRIHTQTAARRVDPDIKPQDVTDAFRTLFASPAPVEASKNQVVTSLSLPEVGGQPGRVSGEVLFCKVQDEKDFGDAAQSDTKYLPAGHVITLRKGEQILLRNAGMAAGDKRITIKDFNTGSKSVLIRAQADGVKIFGPMTLASSDLPDLEIVRAEAKDALNKANRKTLIRKWVSSSDTHVPAVPDYGMAEISTKKVTKYAGGGALVSLASAGVLGGQDAAQVVFVLLVGASMLGVMAGLLNLSEGFETQYSKWMPVSKKTTQINLLEFIHRGLCREGFYIPRDILEIRTFMEHKIAGSMAMNSIQKTCQMDLFPVRKIVTDVDQDVSVIRPQAVLPSPQTDIDLSFTPTALK